MITLHYLPGAASFAPHLLLQETGAAHELVLVDRANGGHKSPGYLKLNPNGLIPVLEDGGQVIFESAAICLHLAETQPAAALFPVPGAPERAPGLQWLMWLTNTLQATLIHYFYPERLVDAGNAEGAAQVKAHAQQRVVELLGILDAEFARHGCPWLLGDRFSAVDAYAFMLCRWTRGFDNQPARSFSQLGPFLQRVLARPSTQRVVAIEGLRPALV